MMNNWNKENNSEKDFLYQLNSPSSGAKSKDLRHFCSPVENQLNSNSCAANATVAALELLQNKKHGNYKDLSRLFVYYNARHLNGDDDKDGGSYIRNCMEGLRKFGVCEESDFEFDLSKILSRPSWLSYQKAYANKINSYYRIDTYGDERKEMIRHAIDKEHPICFGCVVDKKFQNHWGNGNIDLPTGERETVGGHAMLIVGYDNYGDTLIVKNSWSEQWGDKGYCYMPYQYVEISESGDFWVCYVDGDDL